VTTVATVYGKDDDRALRLDRLQEALFIASATHGEIPCAAKGW
jgi:hypothetical protein